MTYEEENAIIDAYNAAKIPFCDWRIGSICHFCRPPIPGAPVLRDGEKIGWNATGAVIGEDGGRRTVGKIVAYDAKEKTISIQDETGTYVQKYTKEYGIGISGAWGEDVDRNFPHLKSDWEEYHRIIARRDKESRRL